MKIRVWRECPPIPAYKKFLYFAVDDDTYEAGQPIGWGTTEEQAVKHLLEEIEWRKS